MLRDGSGFGLTGDKGGTALFSFSITRPSGGDSGSSSLAKNRQKFQRDCGGITNSK